MLIHGDGVFLFGYIGGGQFCQHIHYQFFVGHVVAKVFLAKALEAFVFSGSKACPDLVNNICQCGISGALLDSVLLPLVSNAEVVFLLVIVPICAYLPAGKQLYLLWHMAGSKI